MRRQMKAFVDEYEAKIVKSCRALHNGDDKHNVVDVAATTAAADDATDCNGSEDDDADADDIQFETQLMITIKEISSY